MKLVTDHAAFLGCQIDLTHELLHEVAIPLVAGYSSRRRMRLGQVPVLVKVAQVVAHGSRAHLAPVLAGDSAGTHGSGRGHVFLYQDPQYFFPSRRELFHASSLPRSGQMRRDYI